MIEPTKDDIGREVRYQDGGSGSKGTSRKDLEWQYQRVKDEAAQCRPTAQEQNPSYRAAMRDAGRGRLLP